MKILFVVDGLKRGGKERQLIELITGLKAYTEIQMILLVKKKEFEYFPSVQSNLIILTSEKSSAYYFFRKINTVIKEYKPEIIHSWEGLSSLLSIPASLIWDLKLIDGSIRHAKKFPFYHKFRVIGFINTLFAKRVIANSKAGLKAYNFRESEHKIVIYNGISLNRFNQFSINDDTSAQQGQINIAMVASFSKPKDYQIIVKAGMELLKEYHHINFHFVGQGNELEEVRKKIPNKFSKNFIFYGMVRNVEQILQNMDICVLLTKPGHSEGFSNAIMEYMAMSKPVIASRVGGNPELINENKTGFLIEPGNIMQLVNAIRLLLNDQKLRVQMGNEGRKRIEDYFTIEKMVKSYLHTFKTLN